MFNLKGIAWFVACLFFSFQALAETKAVRVGRVLQAPSEERRQLHGEVVSLLSARISSEVDGRIIRVAQVGQKVEQGAILAIIDDSRLQLESQLIEAEVSGLEVSFSYWAQQSRRLNKLLEKNSAAQHEYDRALLSRDELKHRIAAAKARLAIAKRKLSLTKVKAPFAGVVTEKIAAQGEFIEQGEPLLELVNGEELEVRAYAPLSFRHQLNVGSLAMINGAEHSEQSRILHVLPTSDFNTRMVELRFDVSNLSWIPGEPVEIDLVHSTPSSHWVISRDALVTKGQQSMVAKVCDQKANWISVDVIAPMGSSVIVNSSNLRSTDRVVVVGAEGLAQGQPVKVL